MTFTSYDSFKKNISDKIYVKTGWTLKESREISQALVDKVKSSGGGNWSEYLDYGSYHTSPFRTLRQFLNTLEHTSFHIGENDFRTLLRKFNTMDAIEAVNSFVKKYNPNIITLRKNLWQRSRTKISNASSNLRTKLHENYAKLKALEKISLSELRTKLMQKATVMRIVYAFVNTFSFVTDNEIVVGGLPLGGMGIASPTSIQELEVAHSNKIIKIRAIGSIFLAHQAGGKDSIVIAGKLTGPLRMYWLAALWVLTLLSQGKIQPISDEQISKTENDLRAGIGSLIRLNKIPISKTESIVTQKPAYEKHITFPVVTTHEIITNCYIETFSFEEKIVSDRDVITYNLILRTYDEPHEFVADTQHSVYRQAKGLTKSQQVLRYSLNFMYRMMKWAKEYYYIETNAWKTENYYNIDALDMGMVAGMSLAGIAAGGVV